MNERLKGKYRRVGAPAVIGFSARPRTGNSHGLQKDKEPALQPCGRAPGGYKGKWNVGQTATPMVMVVTYGGKKRMMTEGAAQRVMRGLV